MVIIKEVIVVGNEGTEQITRFKFFLYIGCHTMR